MSDAVRSAVPTFKNSLRRWQAEWKAQKAQAAAGQRSAAELTGQQAERSLTARPRGVGQALAAL